METLRTHRNRAVVAVGLVLALPAVVLAERIRRGGGRRTALVAVRILARLCGVTVEVRGGERLSPHAAYVLVPNHGSILDTPAMVLARPGARFAAAAELFSHPLLGPAMRALGTVPVDRRSPASARRLLEAAVVAGSADLVVFAEGGLAPVGERLRFRTGAFALAIAGGVPVVPVAIAGSDRLLPPGGLLGLRPGRVTVELLDPLPTAGLVPGDRRALRDRAEAAVLHALAGANRDLRP
jgi:1-acyl-sn-glycerol-3-phosphate acyltransferase